MKTSLSILKTLSSIPTAPFFEDAVREKCRSIAQSMFGSQKNVSIKEDKYKNLIVHYRGDPNRKNPKSIAYVVHMDHPAFHVTPLKEKGKYLAVMRGGLNSKILTGAKVKLHRFEKGKIKSARGVITKEFDLVSKGKAERFIIRSKSAGNFSFATLDLAEFRIDSKGVIRAPVLDDLASAAMCFGALERIVQAQSDVDVYIVFHRAEEVGFVGAYSVASANILPKDCFVYSVETSSYKKYDEKKLVKIAKVGGGIILRLGDFRTPSYNFAALHLLHATALSSSVKVQEIRMDAGSCEASLYYALGYRAAGICLPLIAWHNNGSLEGKQEVMPEGVHKDDFIAGEELMVEVAQKLASEPLLFKSLTKHTITKEHEKLVQGVKARFEAFRKEGFI